MQTDIPGFDRRMTKEEINEVPVEKWSGTVQLINTEKDVDQAARAIAQEKVVGFDTETRPAFKKGQKFLPSLLQLATRDCVYLFQLKHIGLPGPLLEILSDPAIIKAGVSLAYDVKELQQLARFAPAGFVDLGTLAKKKGIKNHGLRGLAAVILGIRITKSVQTSNWAKEILTRAQISYAATDAWIGRELYLQLMNKER
jgi:ribonuclease D